MNRRIRICFLTQYLSIGGIETRLLKLLRTIDHERYEPILVCAQDNGLQSEEFKQLGVRVITTNGLMPVNRIRQFLGLLGLMRRLRFRRFDCMMSFLPTSQPFENMLAVFGVRKLAFAFCLVINFRMGRDKDWANRARLARVIVSVSKGSANAIFGGSSEIEKVRVIPNGVDVDLYDKSHHPGARERLGISDADFLISCVARLAPQKRYDVLLDAMAILRARGIRFHCVIAGQDRLDGWVEKRVSELGLAEHVTYLGPSKEVPQLLAACDAFVLTSDNEGCPNAMLEAMATGLPVVVTRSGAEEFVEDGITGYVVPLGSAQAVAERLEHLSVSPELRSDMGRKARDWIKQNASLDIMLDRYFQLFEELAG